MAFSRTGSTDCMILSLGTVFWTYCNGNFVTIDLDLAYDAACHLLSKGFIDISDFQLLTFYAIEVYRFLSSEVRAYLPSYETVTVWHLMDLAMGVKRIIKCDAVKVIDVPQFEGLTIREIFEFAMNAPGIEVVLPPSKEISKLSRSYLSNVIYTVMGEPF